MENYVITTDNTADLLEEYYKNNNIQVASMTYQIDGIIYDKGSFLSNEEFYKKMREGKMPTTAQLNPELFMEMLRPILKKGLDVLHISFSSGLSGTYNNTCIAVRELQEEFPDRKIYTIDSKAASVGQGLLVQIAVDKKNNGMSIEELASYLDDIKDRIAHLFTVDDLEHLYRGGRLSKAAALVGGVLNIKPILNVDLDGKLKPIGKVRGRKKALLELIKLMEERIDTGKPIDKVIIAHGAAIDDAKFLEKKLLEKFDVKEIKIAYIGSVIGTHSGPGTIALIFLGNHK